MLEVIFTEPTERETLLSLPSYHCIMDNIFNKTLIRNAVYSPHRVLQQSLNRLTKLENADVYKHIH